MAAGVASLLAPLITMGDDPTPAPAASQVQTHLRLELKDDVKEVHFINTNNDPYVYTKAYVLKNTDPYEVRPYIVNAIGGYYSVVDQAANNNMGRRVNSSTTKVECVKYMDGVGMLLVSAEDYRFAGGGKENAMSIDEIIAIIDQKDMIYNNNQQYMLYFPKYWDASSLATAIQRVGLNVSDDRWELQGGSDAVRVDQSLNGLLFYYPAYSKKQFEQMLALYDRPSPEALISYTVYELAKENDSQIGMDFQTWLNGPGSDLMGAGMEASRNWSYANMAPAAAKTGSSNANYFNFSPKWNTKFLDFLAVKGSAQVVTSGTLSVMNSAEGYVGSTIRLPTITTDAVARDNGGITAVRYFRNYAMTGAFTSDVSPTVVTNGVALNATQAGTGAGATVTIVEATVVKASGQPTGTVTVYEYYMQTTGSFVDANGKNLGTKIRAVSNAQVTFRDAGTDIGWTTATQTDPMYAYVSMQKAPKRNTTIQTLTTAPDAYGFEMTVVPTVNEEASTMTVAMVNTNLVGFNSDGTARTSHSDVKTQVSVGNKGGKFVIGGLEKEQVLRSENGLPWLNNIPVLGWAFSSERESHKKSQLVAVIECVPVVPEVTVPAGIMTEISKAKEKIANYGVKAGPIDENDFGFEQFILDSDKKSLDPLP